MKVFSLFLSGLLMLQTQVGRAETNGVKAQTLLQQIQILREAVNRYNRVQRWFGAGLVGTAIASTAGIAGLETYHQMPLQHSRPFMAVSGLGALLLVSGGLIYFLHLESSATNQRTQAFLNLSEAQMEAAVENDPEMAQFIDDISGAVQSLNNSL